MLVYYTYAWRDKEGTGDRDTCRCGSWKNHWLNYSGSRTWPATCCVNGCNSKAEDGGHVISNHYYGEWILPLCKEHNNPNFKDWFSVKPGSYVADANRRNTCG